MRVAVEVFGPFRQYKSSGRHTMEFILEKNATVTDLLSLVGIDAIEPWNASLNGTLASPTDVLTEGSVVLFFPPISGGASAVA